MSLKKTILFDLNLLSGSSELLRNTFDSNYRNDVLTFGTYFVDFSLPESLEQFNTNPDLVGLDESSYLPTLTFPTRLTARPEKFTSDEEWRAYLIGTTFADKEYPGIYNTNVYSDHAINDYYLPYKPSEVQRNSEGLSPSIVLTTEYYQNYSRYQAYAAGLASELMLPNYYNLVGTPDRPYFAVSSSDGNYPRHQYPYIKEYLNNTFINEQVDAGMVDKNRNIFVMDKLSDIDSLKHYDIESDSAYRKTEDDLSKIYSLMPFANKLEISRELANFNTSFFDPDDQENLFKKAIEEKQYEYKFVKLLKEIFQNEVSLIPGAVNFGLSTANYSIDYEAGTATELASDTNISLKVLDVPTMLVYGFRNPTPETTDVSVINSSSFNDQITPFEDTNGIYRHIAADKSLDVLNSFKNLINTKFDITDITDIEKFLKKSGETKYHETMAFRIQKIGGPPTGDSRTDNTIQNIWFYNRNDAIKYIDTQVKYDTEYTYKVFSYILLQGYKYQTTGLVSTRKIADEGDVNCLEFYDPYTAQTSPQLNSEESISNIAINIANLQAEIDDLNSIVQNVPHMYNNFLDSFTSEEKDVYLSYGVRYPNIGTTSRDSEYYDDVLKDFRNTVFRKGYKCSQTLPKLRDKTVVCASIDFFPNLIQAINENEPHLLEIERLEQELASFNSEFANALASNAQINTHSRYLADFNITIEPSVKIVEIPLEEKTMRIVDHPPNDFNVSPYHLQDQSNRLAFYLKYDTFSVDTEEYPPTINPVDDRNEASYKEGKDFVPGSLTKEESVSPARFIEVYRTMEKPSSYQSFENNLRKTIDLKNEVGDIMSDHFFAERVRENTKYYYTFRAVNENGVAGQPSPIFESELINDGGYVYGLFNQLSEDELVEQPPTIPTLAIKNLFNVVPNIQHLQFDTSNVDFSDNSVDQIGALTLGTAEEFWNEKFKIRLTSKKTGRKVDLNLTFERKKK